MSLLPVANWCFGVPTHQPVSVWYLKNYHYHHKGNLPPQKNDDSKPLSLQADQYLLIGSATDRPADAPPLLFYLHHTHNKDNISHYNQEWMNFRLIPVFLFDFVQKIHTITDYGRCQKEPWFPPSFTGINITITVLVGLASLTLWLACSPGPGAAASKACHSLFPTLTAYTYFPTTARSVIWHFFEGYLDFELSPPFFHRPYYHCHQSQCWPCMFPKPGKVTTLSLNLTSSADRDRQDTHIAR